MAQRYLTRENGKTKLKQAIVKSKGAQDAGKVPGLNSAGRFDESFMPPGIGAQVVTITASENLTAGKFVNFFADAGELKARLADNSNGRAANGYVKESADADTLAMVYPLDGVNSELSGLQVGQDYWLGTAGGVIETPLDENDDGNANFISQQLGKAKTATELITDDFGYVIL